ncbi:MAG: hypothetical protein ACK56W_22750 [Pirellula sp.]
MIDVATKRTRKSFVESLTHHRSPSAIAAGTSFGVALGLIPKDSLLALALLLAILLLSVNQIAACVFAIGLSLFSGWTIGITHAVGNIVLQSDVVASFIGSLYQLPLIPWFRLENTAVMGGTVIGALLWLPMFLLSLRFCNQVREVMQSEQMAELAAASIRHRRDRDAEMLGQSDDLKTGMISMPQSTTVDGLSVIAIPKAIAESKSVESIQPENSVIRDRAKSDTVTNVEANFESIACKLESLAGDTVLKETLIEVVRYKRPRREKTEVEPPITHHNPSNPMKLASPVSSEAVSTPRNSDANTKFHSPNTGTTHVLNNPLGKEESLRHILKHIHGSREAKKETGKPA